MNAAAVAVMTELPDVVVGYGVSDEYRYVFCPVCWGMTARLLLVVGKWGLMYGYI